MPKNDGTVHYLIVNDARSLMWLTNQNTHHAARLDVARAGPAISPTCACSISIRRRGPARSPARRGARVRDLLAELG